jgi:uncharacterized protein (TIGR03089 family)
MPNPPDVLAAMLRADPARPRVTFYEDTDGPTRGERIELSAKVLANWVNKAANALQDDFDVAPGSRVRLALPPHWRSLYWALAVWSVGGTVVADRSPAEQECGAPVPDAQASGAQAQDPAVDLVVTDDPALAAGPSPAVLVTLAALARQAAVPTGGAMDEARELSTHGDQFVAWEEPAEGDVALEVEGAGTPYALVVADLGWPRATRAHLRGTDLATVLTQALAAWAGDGSVVLSRGELPAEDAARREAVEGVTLVP